MNYYMTLLSILLGWLPEAIFFSVFVIGAKGIKRGNRRMPLFVFFSVTFMTLGMVFADNIWLYVILTAAMYLIMKLLYKDTEFIDLFLLTIPYLILAVIGYVCYGIGNLLPSYLAPPVLMTIVNRILLIILIPALYPHLNNWYNTYKHMWNVHKDNTIKSITVRNISILLSNAMIIAAYISIILLGK